MGDVAPFFFPELSYHENCNNGHNTVTNRKEVNIMANSNQHVVPQAGQALDQMKFEVAQSLGVQLNQGYNGDLPTREAGRIGGNITRQLVQIAEQQLAGQFGNR